MRIADYQSPWSAVTRYRFVTSSATITNLKLVNGNFER